MPPQLKKYLTIKSYLANDFKDRLIASTVDFYTEKPFTVFLQNFCDQTGWFACLATPFARHFYQTRLDQVRRSLVDYYLCKYLVLTAYFWLDSGPDIILHQITYFKTNFLTSGLTLVIRSNLISVRHYFFNLSISALFFIVGWHAKKLSGIAIGAIDLPTRTNFFFFLAKLTIYVHIKTVRLQLLFSFVTLDSFLAGLGRYQVHVAQLKTA